MNKYIFWSSVSKKPIFSLGNNKLFNCVKLDLRSMTLPWGQRRFDWQDFRWLHNAADIKPFPDKLDIIIRCSGPFYASQDSSIWCAVVQFYRTLKRFNADEWNRLLWDTEILVTACRKVKSNLLCIFSLSWENKQPLNLSKWDTLDKEVPWGQVRGHLKKRFSHLWLSGCRHWCAFAQTSFARHTKYRRMMNKYPRNALSLMFFLKKTFSV